MELDEGMFLLGLQAAAWRVPFLPTRVGLGSDVLRASGPSCARCVVPVRRRRGAGRHARAHARRRARPHDRADAAATASSSARSVLRRPVLHGRPKRVHIVRAGRADRGARDRTARADAADQPAAGRRRGRGSRTAPTSPSACPTTDATRPSSASTRATARDPDAWAAWQDKYLDCGDHDAYRKVVGL